MGYNARYLCIIDTISSAVYPLAIPALICMGQEYPRERFMCANHRYVFGNEAMYFFLWCRAIQSIFAERIFINETPLTSLHATKCEPRNP